MNKRIRKKKERQLNKYLCKRYPFVIPRNRWTDKIPKDYKYDYTELYYFPKGWFKAFGFNMLEEIRDDLIKYHYLNDFRICEIKEKYGGLRFYFGPIPIESKVSKIVSKYEDMSFDYCERCGRPTTTKEVGHMVWTICDDCKKRIEERRKAYLRRSYESKR